MSFPGKKYELKELRLRIAKYCAYRERCHKEVRNKLREYKITSDDVDLLISELIEQNLLNEERYALAYCRGKFLYNDWGRNKIKAVLKSNEISDYCIRKGMEEIDEEAYLHKMKKLLSRHFSSYSEVNDYAAKNKSVQFMMRKGYEAELLWEAIKEIE